MPADLDAGPRGWMAATVDDPEAWRVTIPTELVDAYAAGEGDVLDAPDDLVEAWSQAFAPALDALNDGRGFVLFDRVPVESLSEGEAKRVYWRIGQSLGRPIEQNIEGTLLYDVRDTGVSVGEGARFSVTNAESTFHTDAAFADRPPEFVGLLVLQTAKSGGESELVSAYTVHDVLAAESPDLLEVLYRDFQFDRRGQFLPGEPELKVAPVFGRHGDELDTRYLHYYITEGHQAGEPLTAEQEAALEKVVEVVTRPLMRVTFAMSPGDVLFTNNNWILHNRTRFTDHVEVERRRHYVRLWLERRHGGPASAKATAGRRKG